MTKKIVEIKEIKNLLDNGKTIKVKSKNGEYVKVTKYVDKGILDTFNVILENEKFTKVSREHKFFTNVGWVECQNIIPKKHSILCDDGKYSLVNKIEYIGKYKIVDISVDHPDQCYFGNGMLHHNTGKSLICAHILANTQKKGGLGIMIDTENAAAPLFWSAVGVSIKNLVYVNLVTVEEIFSKIEEAIGVARKNFPDRLVTIVVDSLAMASCDTEMESEHGKDGYNTSKAIIISKALRKITGLIGKQRILVVFTNQLRMNMATGPVIGDKYVVPGGKAMGFAASVRVRLSNTGQLRKSGGIIGNGCKAVVTKNRMGPPRRFAEFEIHFDSGIQNLKSWIDWLETNKYATKSGQKYTLNLPDKDKLVLTLPEFVDKINTDTSFKDDVYNIIANEYIMKYRDPNSKIVEDIEVDENSEED